MNLATINGNGYSSGNDNLNRINTNSINNIGNVNSGSAGNGIHQISIKHRDLSENNKSGDDNNNFNDNLDVTSIGSPACIKLQMKSSCLSLDNNPFE